MHAQELVQHFTCWAADEFVVPEYVRSRQVQHRTKIITEILRVWGVLHETGRCKDCNEWLARKCAVCNNVFGHSECTQNYDSLLKLEQRLLCARL